MEQYDLVVIGAGPGGYVAAIRAAQCGMKVALVENREVGGTCLNRGCIPTKALIHATELFRQMQSCAQFGLSAAHVDYKMTEIHAYKDSVTSQLRTGIEQLIRANRVTLLNGSGQIGPGNTVHILSKGEETAIHGDNILIATGSVPSVPPIKGIELPGVVTSDAVLSGELQKFDSLVIIGGGVIGVEFATIFQSLGCEVTIIEALPSILAGMDREISQSLRMILKKRGVEIFTDARVEEITQEQRLSCHFDTKGSKQEKSADAVIVAVGRRANTSGLFRGDFALAMERGKIVVDSGFQTSSPNIYAIGDVSGGIQLAHVASAQGTYVAEKISGHTPTVDLSVVPSCIYTDPEIACVGLTADAAKQQNIPVRVGKFATSANGKSIISKEERGFVKVVFDEKTDKLLGAQMMCARATDMIGELCTAIACGLTAEQLTRAMRAHPTYNESISEAIEDAFGKAIHTMPKKK